MFQGITLFFHVEDSSEDQSLLQRLLLPAKLTARLTTLLPESIIETCSVVLLSSLKEILQMNIPPSHIVIYSDSQAAIMALTNPRPKSVIICQTQEIIPELKKRNHIILLQWVPAHVGVDYNERVDELVKQGRDKSSEISTAELADVCALVKTKVESSTPKKFDCQPVMKLNTSREIYSAIVRLRS